VTVDARSSDRNEPLKLPRLYPIVDMECIQSFSSSKNPTDTAFHLSILCEYVAELAAGGSTLFQLRGKQATARQLLSGARGLKRLVGQNVKLIMNDRADLCLAAGFDGVHLGQDDLSAEGARKVLGNGYWIGVSTHNLEQLAAADAGPADYLAIGPIFATATKQNPDPVVGLAGLREARKLTVKPLVAIGGITRENCKSVLDAGADSVAVISDLVNQPRRSVEDFLRILM
jgi:thiamine-phosphate pyrophosphorylase